MKYALLVMYLHFWQIEGFFGTEEMCVKFVNEINDQRKEEGEPRYNYACLRINDEPIFYSR